MPVSPAGPHPESRPGEPDKPLADWSLEQVHECIMACTDCDLSQGRSRAVPGEGAGQAEILFLGEAPGWHEDQSGRPFVGPAGQFLEDLLRRVSLERSQVFITNVVKCRPPNNRDPMPWEVQACHQYLQRQLELIQPTVVTILGRIALAQFFPKESIARAHGTWRWKDGLLYFAMYHPAAALHQGSLRRTIEEDIKKLPEALAAGKRGGRDEGEEKPQQLSLM